MTNETRTRIREVALRAALAVICEHSAAEDDRFERAALLAAVERELGSTIAGAEGLISFLGADLAQFLYVPLSKDGWDEVGFDEPTGSFCLWSALREAVVDDTLKLLESEQSTG